VPLIKFPTERGLMGLYVVMSVEKEWGVCRWTRDVSIGKLCGRVGATLSVG